MIDTIKQSAQFIKHIKNTGSIDVVVAELPEEVVKKLSWFFVKNDFPLKVDDFGHFAMLLNRLHDNARLYACDIVDYESTLDDAKAYMEKKGKRTLYQICQEKNLEKVKAELIKRGYKLI